MLESHLDYRLVREPKTHLHQIYADIEPRGSRWLPWPGRNARWWFEVHERCDDPDCETTTITHAYCKGGSGGAWTLSRTLRKAYRYDWEGDEGSD